MIINDFMELLQNALLEFQGIIQEQKTEIERQEDENQTLIAAVKFYKNQASDTQLPCSIGDTVYQIYEGRILETKIKGLIFTTDYAGFDKGEIGRYVFLTREEAEQALKERS